MEGVSSLSAVFGVIFLDFDDVSPEPYPSFLHFVYQVLLSVQPRERIFRLLRTHRHYPGDQGLSFFLRYFNSSPRMAISHLSGEDRSFTNESLLFSGLILRRVYTDVVGKRLIFLSASRFDFYHEKMVSWLSSVTVDFGIPFVCDPSDSRYSGYDLEIRGLNVEFESGLKASYRDLEDRIAISRSRVVIVVPNEEVRVRYVNHFRLWDVDVISLSGWESYLKCNYFS